MSREIPLELKKCRRWFPNSRTWIGSNKWSDDTFHLWNLHKEYSHSTHLERRNRSFKRVSGKNVWVKGENADMGQIQTIKDMAKQVADEAKKNLEVNDIPLEEFIVKVDGVAEFLKTEIRICDKRLGEEPNPYYDGVNVGFNNAQELTINHIRFCKKLLEMMNVE